MQRFTACVALPSFRLPVRCGYIAHRALLVSVSLVRPLLPYAWITRQVADVYHSVEVQPILPDWWEEKRVTTPCPRTTAHRDRHSCKGSTAGLYCPIYCGLAPHGSLAGIYVSFSNAAPSLPWVCSGLGILTACSSHMDSFPPPVLPVLDENLCEYSGERSDEEAQDRADRHLDHLYHHIKSAKFFAVSRIQYRQMYHHRFFLRISPYATHAASAMRRNIRICAIIHSPRQSVLSTTLAIRTLR